MDPCTHMWHTYHFFTYRHMHQGLCPARYCQVNGYSLTMSTCAFTCSHMHKGGTYNTIALNPIATLLTRHTSASESTAHKLFPATPRPKSLFRPKGRQQSFGPPDTVVRPHNAAHLHHLCATPQLKDGPSNVSTNFTGFIWE